MPTRSTIPFDWLALPWADEDRAFIRYRVAVDIAILRCDDMAAYIYARMSARYAIRALGFQSLPEDIAS